MDSHPGGVGTRDLIRSADQIKKFLVAGPSVPFDRFIVHHGDVRSLSAKGVVTKTKKQ